MKSVGIFLAVEPRAGGMFQYAESLLDALRTLHGNGWHVEVAYVTPSWEPILDRYPFPRHRLRMGEEGLRLAQILMVLRVPGWMARKISSVFNPIVRQLKEIDCNLWIFPAQDALTWQVDLPAVGTTHDLMHRYEPQFPEVSGSGRFRIREHRFRNIAEWSRAILVDSEIGRQQVMASYGTPAEKIHPLPYIAPNDIRRPEPTDFDARFKLPSKFLFYPAQFWPHKNHGRLIEAASRLRESLPDLQLVFTGSKDHSYEQVHQHAKQCGLIDRVHFMGYVPYNYLSGFYRRARAMIMPTFFGPTNIPPLEAFACNCACAVSNVYGMPEQTKGAALLFDQTSVADIANSMERLWRDDALVASLAARGRNVVREWDSIQFSARLQDILQQAHEAMGRDADVATRLQVEG